MTKQQDLMDRYQKLAKDLLTTFSALKKLKIDEQHEEELNRMAVLCIRDYYCLLGAPGRYDKTLFENNKEANLNRLIFFLVNFPHYIAFH